LTLPAQVAVTDLATTGAGNDSVWVFVDYNTRGTMKRLPSTGATATPHKCYGLFMIHC
jgi:hypothetical protein